MCKIVNKKCLYTFIVYVMYKKVKRIACLHLVGFDPTTFH